MINDHRRPHRRRRTKEDYLDAALVLANEHAKLGVTPYAYAVAHVDVAQVAGVAGVSRTALYRLWETQEAFRADLAAYLATLDDAPWMDLDARRFASRLSYPEEFQELARKRLNSDQHQLGADPRPLLRAGIAGYPNANAVTAVIADRERWRLARHAYLVNRALQSTGRRCVYGLEPMDISVVTTCMADGLALATRTTPPGLPLNVDLGDPPRPWSLFALAVCALFDTMSEPDPQGNAPLVWPELPSCPQLPAAPVEHTGRRLHYLRVAAELAIAEPPGTEPADSCAIGYVGLDALARAVGVTRTAVRKLWPTQASFRFDLFAHLLSRHREVVVRRLHHALPRSPGHRTTSNALLQAGDKLFGQMQEDNSRVNHLTFAPQFVLPSFRTYIHQHMDPLLDATEEALTDLLAAVGQSPRPGIGERQLTVLVLALVDGMTRVARTVPEVARSNVVYEGGCHSLLAIALERLLRGLTQPRTLASLPAGPMGMQDPPDPSSPESPGRHHGFILSLDRAV